MISAHRAGPVLTSRLLPSSAPQFPPEAPSLPPRGRRPGRALTRWAGALLQLAHGRPRELQRAPAGRLQRAHVGVGVPVGAAHSVRPATAAHAARALQALPARRVEGAAARLALAGRAHQAAVAQVGHVAAGAAGARAPRHVAARGTRRRRGLSGQRQRGQRGQEQRARRHRGGAGGGRQRGGPAGHQRGRRGRAGAGRRPPAEGTGTGAGHTRRRLRRAGRGATGACRAGRADRRGASSFWADTLRAGGSAAFKGARARPALAGRGGPTPRPAPPRPPPAPARPSRPGPTRPPACLVWERQDMGQLAGPEGRRGPLGTGLGPPQSPCASLVRAPGSKDLSSSCPQGHGRVRSPCSSAPARPLPQLQRWKGRCHPSWLPTSTGDRPQEAPALCLTSHSLQLGGRDSLSALSDSPVWASNPSSPCSVTLGVGYGSVRVSPCPEGQ